MTSSEDKANKSVPEIIVEPEVARLQDLSGKISEVFRYLMQTFFQDNTWDVRQEISYGIPLLEVERDGKGHNREREEEIKKRILTDLGDRIHYFNAAYYFPDIHSALRYGSGPSWLELMANRSGEPKAMVAEKIFTELQATIAIETSKFENFLSSDIFQQAFSIKVDRKTGEYTISDLTLDPDQMRIKWNELLVGPTKSNN